MSVVRRIQIGENHKSAEVLNRPTDDILTLSGQTLGATFPGFVSYPTLAGEIGVTSNLYPVGDVRRYGAKGDGVSDDAAAIATADIASRFAGVSTFFAPGTYLLGSAIAAGAGSVWVSIGRSATLKHKAGALHSLITSTSVAGLKLYSLKIDGNMANTTTAANRWARPAAISCTTVTDILFDDCEITGTQGPAISGTSCTRVRMRGCYVHDTDSWCAVFKQSTDVVYESNHAENIYTHGFYVDGTGGTGALRVRMIGNTAISCLYDATFLDSGIGLSVNYSGSAGVEDVQVIGNTARNCGSMGLSLTPVNAPSDNGKMVVQGNLCEGHTANIGIGIELIASNVVLSGNICKNNKYGITTQTGKMVAIAGNRLIMAAGQIGVFLSPTVAGVGVNGVRVTHNLFDGGTGVQVPTNAVTTAHQNVAVEHNTFVNCDYATLLQQPVTTFSWVGNQVDATGAVGAGKGWQGSGIDVLLANNVVKPKAGASAFTWGATTAGCDILDNVVVGGGTCTAFDIEAGGLSNFSVGGNVVRGGAVDRLNWQNIDTSSNDHGTNSWNFVSVVPSTGTWNRGQRVFLTAPSAAGVLGYVCTVSGTSGGTWKAFSVVGEIQAVALADLGALSTTQTSGASYTATEQAMLASIKTDLTAIRTEINTLLANRRTAGEQA